VDSGEWRPLRLKDDLPAVVKSDLEASGKVTANKGFIAKYANDGSTYPRVSKFCNFYPADIPQFGQQSPYSRRLLLLTLFSDTPRPKGGASSGQAGPADYRLLRGHLPFIGRRCFYWGSHPPIPLRIKIYLGGICPPNPLTGMPFLPAQRVGLPGIVSEFSRWREIN
jgi:hypothetical protein